MEETFLLRVIIFYAGDNSEDVLTCFRMYLKRQEFTGALISVYSSS